MLIAADGETVTFGEFRRRAERAAAGLHDMGVTTGSVVSWQLPTGIDTVVVNAEMRNWVFVKVETDQPGLYGWGEGTLEWKTRGVVGTVEDMAPIVTGLIAFGSWSGPRAPCR